MIMDHISKKFLTLSIKRLILSFYRSYITQRKKDRNTANKVIQGKSNVGLKKTG